MRHSSTHTRRIAAATALCCALAAFGTQAKAPALEPAPLPVPSAPAPLSPAQVYVRAFQRLESYPVPDYAIWVSSMKTTRLNSDSQPTVENLRYAERMSDGLQNASGFPVGGALPPALIGPHFQGPFAWSLRSKPVASPSAMQPDIPTAEELQPALKTIAIVEAIGKPKYAISIAGTQTVNERETMHLVLQPLGDAGRRNLRDLWVDPTTFDIVKAHFIGTYVPNPGAIASQSDVTVDFKPIASYWVVSHAVWTYAPIDVQFQFDATTYLIGFPAALPDWLFDEKAYARHRAAHDPDFLTTVFEPGAR